MNVLEELKDLVEVKVTVNEEKLANKLFDHVVLPLLGKITDLIPTEIDDAFVDANQDKIRAQFLELLAKASDSIESKVDEVLGNE